MSESFDVIVIGLGAMGSAAAYHLARSRSRILGIDRFHPPHEFGSSHGKTRIIREAYYESPVYVPLVRRAYELWEELEQNTNRELFLKTGGITMGAPESEIIRGARQSALQHQIPHEILDGASLRKRFPVFQPPAGAIACWEPRAGILFPERVIQTHLELAAKAGATLHFDEPVLRWERDGEGVIVFTERNTYLARGLLLTAGAWLSSLLQDLKLPLAVERQVQFWFDPRENAESFLSERCPVYIGEAAGGRFFYGFPNLGEGIKAAIHHNGKPADPDHLDRNVTGDEIQAIRNILKSYMPSANGPLRSSAVCMYTNAPDHHFIFGRHPACPQALIASPCSGHGFKFSAIIGELAAKSLTGQKIEFDLSLFSPERFSFNGLSTDAGSIR